MMECSNYQESLNGRFEGVLRWPQLDDLWHVLKSSEQPWYFYQVGSEVPTSHLSSENFVSSLDSLDTLMRKEHDYDYCGIVYTDDLENPSLIKVYDPNNLGSSCGCGGSRIPPRWIISQTAPDEIVDDAPTPQNRKRWWQQMFRLR